MKVTIPKQYDWRYFRNLLMTAFVALVFAFYGIIPLASAYRAIHPTRHPVGFVSPADLDLNYENEPKVLWARPKDGHIDALFAHPQEYEEKVVDFFNQVLLENR